MSEEELEAAGLNRSDVHVDFMIGSNQMDIDGIREGWNRYLFSVMEIGQIKEITMIGSMFVGLLVGFLAGAMTNHWRANGMLWENVSRLDRCLFRSLIFGSWGPSLSGTAIIPAVLGAMILPSHLLGKRKLSFTLEGRLTSKE